MSRLAPKPTALAAVVALTVLSVLTLPGCASSNSGPTSSSSPSPVGVSPTSSTPTAAVPPPGSGTTSGAASGGASAAPVEGTQIVINKFLYSPVNLKVKPGATVTVMNQDPVAHTVTAQSGAGGIAFDSGTINANASGTFTAPTTPGTYPYICIFHAQMHGILTVSS